MLKIKPASHLEDEVFNRALSGIPSGNFYLTAQYVQPRWGGTTRVNFVIEGTKSNMVSVYLSTEDGNDQLLTRVGMSADTTMVSLPLKPPPDINYIRAVDGVYDAATDTWTATGEESGCSVVVVNYGTVHYGMASDWYQHVWLPYVIQNWSVTSEWGCRLVEWTQLYHNLFPDTQAMRTLAVRLVSRATWHEQPTTRGVIDQVAALCATQPFVRELSNNRPWVDTDLWPLLPIFADYGGHEFNVWVPDIPTARQLAVTRLVENLDYMQLQAFYEPNVYLTCQGDNISLRKDDSRSNLSYLLRQIGPMDYWKAWLSASASISLYRHWWDNALDNVVREAGLGQGVPFDTSWFDLGVLDTREPWTELWDDVGLNVVDGDPDIGWDSVVEVAVDETQLSSPNPPQWNWEYTTLEASCSTTREVSNPLYGGAPAGYVP